MHDDPHAHRPKLRSERGRYAEFVDELFRLDLIDREKRDFLREGLRLAGAAATPEIVQPSSAHCRVSEAGLSSPAPSCARDRLP